MANYIVAKKMSTIALTGGRAFFVPAGFTDRGNIMTEGQETNGKNQAERKRAMLWEIYGIDQEDCSAIVEQHIDNTRKLDNAEDKVRMACDIVELLKAADENTADGSELSRRTLDQLDRVQSLLKSAQKKIDKYENEQKIRDIENWKQGAVTIDASVLKAIDDAHTDVTDAGVILEGVPGELDQLDRPDRAVMDCINSAMENLCRIFDVVGNPSTRKGGAS